MMFIFMLFYSLWKITSDANIDCTISTICKYVDVSNFIHADFELVFTMVKTINYLLKNLSIRHRENLQVYINHPGFFVTLRMTGKTL